MSKEEPKVVGGSTVADPKPGLPEKKYRLKPRYPPISDMLAFGSPEEQGKPKTFIQIISGPVLLAIVFCISFIIFLNAPHHLSKGAERNTYAMNQKHPRYVKPKVIPYVPPVEELKPINEDPAAKETLNAKTTEGAIPVETESRAEL
jgi:hypothetical protein